MSNTNQPGFSYIQYSYVPSFASTNTQSPQQQQQQQPNEKSGNAGQVNTFTYSTSNVQGNPEDKNKPITYSNTSPSYLSYKFEGYGNSDYKPFDSYTSYLPTVTTTTPSSSSTLTTNAQDVNKNTKVEAKEPKEKSAGVSHQASFNNPSANTTIQAPTNTTQPDNTTSQKQSINASYTPSQTSFPTYTSSSLPSFTSNFGAYDYLSQYSPSMTSLTPNQTDSKPNQTDSKPQTEVKTLSTPTTQTLTFQYKPPVEVNETTTTTTIKPTFQPITTTSAKSSIISQEKTPTETPSKLLYYDYDIPFIYCPGMSYTPRTSNINNISFDTKPNETKESNPYGNYNSTSATNSYNYTPSIQNQEKPNNNAEKKETAKSSANPNAKNSTETINPEVTTTNPTPTSTSTSTTFDYTKPYPTYTPTTTSFTSSSSSSYPTYNPSSYTYTPITSNYSYTPATYTSSFTYQPNTTNTYNNTPTTTTQPTLTHKASNSDNHHNAEKKSAATHGQSQAHTNTTSYMIGDYGNYTMPNTISTTSTIPTTGGFTKPAEKSSSGDQKTLNYQIVKIKNDYGAVKEAKDFVDDPNSRFNQIWNQLKGAKQKFSDTEFPPSNTSLGESQTFNSQDIVWCRPEIYYKGNFRLYEGDVSIEDIKQGTLGDCYFLCTLAALAEWPYRIQRLFVNKEANKEGIYAVRINDMGEWHEVIVDDQLPCWADEKTPAFAKGNGNELWVCLLEKAWAKLFGSYARIEAGDTREALHDLTGAPTKYFYLADLDEEEKDHLWSELLHGEKNDFVMTCSSPCVDGCNDQDDRDGIYFGHAYSLLSAHEVQYKGSPLKLLRIRNPHSHGEWKGAWSDTSPLWTEEVKRQVQWTDADDGTFYMSWRDFFEYYEDCSICKVHDNYHYNSLRLHSTKPNENIYFKITAPKDGKYYITINQENKRHHDETEGFEHSPVYALLAFPNGNKFEEIEQKNETGREIWTDAHLNAGDYYLYTQIDWFDGKDHPIVISSYGPDDVTIKRMYEHENPQFIEFCKRYQQAEMNNRNYKESIQTIIA